MATLLIRLNGAPDDELEELRALLVEHGIDFYETDAGRWGISVAALWLRDDEQLAQARQLIDDYQQHRVIRARAAHHEQLQNGAGETLLTRLAHDPLRTLLYLLMVSAIVALTLLPFLGVI